MPYRDTPSKFHVVVPYLDQGNYRERLATTLTSMETQTAVRAGLATVQITVACGRALPDLYDWIELRFPNVELEVRSDAGIYDALAGVLHASDADFFGWLGAGDIYEATAFSVVLENAPQEHRPYWITGLMRGRREDGAVVRSFLPFRYRKRFFDSGIHGTLLPTLQQESTFWNSWLHCRIDFTAWARLRLAGDFFLWKTFIQFSDPVVVEAALGSFTWHGDNHSQDYNTYTREIQTFTRTPRHWERLAARLDLLFWALHPALKARFARGSIRRFSWPAGPWVN